ncbi:DNA-binding protein [Bacillus pseudomycoides]|uniref:DNA-binding protein n=1 Tax=Bacillus pseudomycoides TaxID=64104 RepID=A0AA91VAY3_9BACI|nr:MULTISPECIES: DnaD domain protein [Bacillus]PEB56221.1 DNA-binding protein [Bacillus sp. AFS098217]PED81651.1 DNA-binding protein [Bacillus pseudomycoides]
MGIFRVKKDNNYSVINNTGLKDERLSWKAKGILAYILTLPDDWVFYREELSSHAKDGIDSLKAGMKELKEYGYLKRFPIRDEQNRIVRWETVIHEIPQNEPLAEKPPMENPQMEKPPVEIPPVENPLLLNTNIQSTEELNTDIQNTNHHHDNNNSSQKLIDEEFKISYNFLLKNGIALSEIAITELGGFCDTLGSELIIHAANKAIDENVPKWRYVRGILDNWKKRKVKTLNDIAVLDAQFELSKNKKRSGTNYGTRKEVVPDWLRQQQSETETEQKQKSANLIDEERKRLQAVLQKYKS